MSAEQPISLLSSDEEDEQPQEEQRRIAVRRPAAAAAAAAPSQQETSNHQQALAGNDPSLSQPAALKEEDGATSSTSLAPSREEKPKSKKRALLTSVAPLSASAAAPAPSSPDQDTPTNIGTASSSTATRREVSAMSNSNNNDDNPAMEDDTNLASLQAFAMSKDHDDSDDYDSDDDRDNDKFVNQLLGHPEGHGYHIDEPESLKFLQHHCWVCRSWIEHPAKLESRTKDDFDTNEREYCCYLQHEHPTLSVPVCIVCSEKLEDAVPSPPSSPTRKEEGDIATESRTTCCGCGRDASEDFNPLWFSCDECPRAFCQHCLAQAHGEESVVNEMQKSKGPWKCCSCAPPDFLRELQNYTSKLQAGADQAIAAAAEKEGDSKNGELSSSEEAKQCELLSYLDMVEEKKAECDEALDDIDQDAESIAVWEDHRCRLVDTIATIQDKLKSEHGIETLKVYQEIDGPERISRLREDEEAEPEWKRLADKEIAKRARENRKKGPKEDNDYDPNDKRYRIEITSDVEDLGDEKSSGEDDGNEGSDSVTSYAEFRAGWRHSQYKPSQEAIDEALEEEEKRFEERHIVATVCNRADDAKEMKNWVKTLKPPKHRRSKKSKQDGKSLSSSTSKRQSSPKQPSAKRRSIDTELPSDSSVDEMQHSSTARRSTRKKASSVVLSREPMISVANELATKLKQHQREGIKFMYDNTFADLGGDSEAEIGGCICAHSMGLGKSFSVIALLHTLMFLPNPKIRKVLLVVPVNTVANWEDQFRTWQKDLKPKITPRMPGDGNSRQYREKEIRRWSEKGGVLLLSDGLFRSSMNSPESKASLVDADAIILDESHTMLKTKGNKLFKALYEVKTPRRICLTGTPFQNNLLEYFRMFSYIRPGLLGTSEPHFKNNYVDPIEKGMAVDAYESIQSYADELITGLNDITGPYMHRRDAKVLVAELPPLQQVVLHIRPTSMQRSAYQSYRKYQRATGQKNFLHQFASLRPIHNHPATILYRESEAESKQQKGSRPAPSKNDQRQPPNASLSRRQSNPSIKVEKNVVAASTLALNKKSGPSGQEPPEGIIDLISSEDEDEDAAQENEAEAFAEDGHWSDSLRKQHSQVELEDPSHGNKCVLLLHILMQAQTVGDKSLLFSQSLATLDFLEKMLASKDWAKLVPSLQKSFPGKKMGGWRAGIDFVRIDGSTSGYARGEKIKDFETDDNIKLFLISVTAGSLGINLTSANRVVLMDRHFNPSVDLQAIYRTYRYGQTKPVYCYRLLTQGSMEEKVYSRAVTKSGLAGSVVDGKAFLRLFDQKELDSLAKSDVWVECTNCKRWRMFPIDSGVEEDTVKGEENWRCEMMNQYDLRLKWKCSLSEKESDWYTEHYKKPNRPMNEKKASTSQLIDAMPGRLSDEEAKKLVEQDVILKDLLGVVANDKQIVANDKQIVSKHYFHDALLTDEDASNTVEDKGAGKESQKSSSSKKSPSKSTPKRKQQNDQDGGSRNGTPHKRAKVSESSKTQANGVSGSSQQKDTEPSDGHEAEPENGTPRKRARAAEPSSNHANASPGNPQQDQKKPAQRVSPPTNGCDDEWDL